MIMIVTGSARNGSDAFDLAASLAAMYSLLAGRRTLLVDLSLESDRALSFTVTGGLPPLLDRFLAAQGLDPDSVRGQLTPVAMPAGHALAGRSFDLLAGPAAVTPEYADNLSAQRGEAFVRALHAQIVLLNYDVVIVDFGQGLDTLRGAALANLADLIVVVGHRDDPGTRAFIQKRLQPPHFSPPRERVLLAEAGEQAFPHPEFVESLTRSEKRFENADARTALGLAELLDPGISQRLTDAAGRPIRPVQPGLLRRLFG